MRRAFAILAATGLLLATLLPAGAYPSLAGPTGGAITPNTDLARGIEIRATWHRVRARQAEDSYNNTEPERIGGRVGLGDRGLQLLDVFGSYGLDRVNVLSGNVTWGSERWELGAMGVSLDSADTGGAFSGTGFGVHGKWQWASEARGDSFGMALGGVFMDIDDLIKISGFAALDVEWSSVYLVLSRQLTDQITGNLGVAWDNVKTTLTGLSPTSIGFGTGEADEFNYFASLAATSRDGRHTYWAEYRTGLSGGDNLYAVAVRRQLGANWEGQVGWTNALGPLPVGLDNGSWFMGVMYRIR